MCSATGEYIKHRMLLLYDEKSLEEERKLWRELGEILCKNANGNPVEFSTWEDVIPILSKSFNPL